MKEHFRKEILILLGMLLSFLAVQSQVKYNPDGFVNNGGTLLTEESSLIASVGEPIVGLSSEGSFHCLQGFVYKTIPADFKTDAEDIELVPEMEVKIYPNPASDFLQIELKYGLPSIFNYSITSLNGRKIKLGILNGKRTTINISDIITSSYLFTIYSKEDEEVLYTTLFIKQ